MIKNLILLFVSAMLCYTVTAQDATTILQKSDEKVRGTESAYSEMTITIVRKSWSREMALRSWAKGDDHSMIYITAPVKDKGVVFLKREKEVWNYLPTIERTIKLPPSMMMQSWMGTDFTNDDLVKESSIVEDYYNKLDKDSIIGGRTCYKIILHPKPETAVVWGKIVVFIDKKEFIQLRSEMYDEDDYLINIMNASDIRLMGGKMIAAQMEMIPVEKPGQKTMMRIDNIVFDDPMREEFFTVQQMKQLH